MDDMNSCRSWILKIKLLEQVSQTLHKIWENMGFHWPVFSRIRAESYFHIFYAVKISKKCTKRILTWKKHPQIKLQRLQKVWIWTFGWLVYQVNSLYVVLKLKQNVRKNKTVAGKTLFFAIGPFCTPHSICLNIGFWQSSFVW